MSFDATSTAIYTAAAPTTTNLETAATALAGEANIASATWRNGSRYSEIVIVTDAINNAVEATAITAAETAITDAVTAVGGLILRPGQSITTTTEDVA